MAESADLKKRIKRENQIRDRNSEILSLRVEQVTNDAVTVVIDAVDAQDDFDFVITDIEGALVDAGLEDVLDDIEAAYGDELGFIADEYERITGGNVFTQDDVEAIQAIVTADVERIGATARAAGINLRAEIIRATVIGTEPDVDILADLTGALKNRVKTELNTGMAAFNRTMTIKKAIDVFGPNPDFIYIGPDDRKTRDFCDNLLSQRTPPVYSLAEIRRLDNGQGLDVFSSGGGFNCRHDWRPFTDALREEFA